jgi:hypothetical protein
MHALTLNCPLTCLEPLLPARAYHALQAACPGPHPKIGHVVDLYRRQEITRIPRIGAQAAFQIQTCLASAGLIGPATTPAGDPPPAPARRHTRLLTEQAPPPPARAWTPE